MLCSNFLENLFFGKKMYPSNAKRSFFLRRKKTPSDRQSTPEQTQVNEAENPREPGFGETKWHQVKPSDTKVKPSDTKWHQVKPSEAEVKPSEAEVKPSVT